MEEQEKNYYRVKTEFTNEKSDGGLEKVKIEELVYATCYTEVEHLIHNIISEQSRSKFGSVSYDITKTKIADILYNDILEEDEPFGKFGCNYFNTGETSEEGLYAVKIVTFGENEKTGKETTSTQILYVPAYSNADAITRVHNFLHDSTEDYVVRDTKFDKAEAIYWPIDVQKSKVQNYSGE